MSLPWFRFYREVKDDPKMGKLSDADFRVFVEAMCWACEAEANGSTDLKLDDVNWSFRRDVQKSIENLIHVGLLSLSPSGHVTVTKWNERQSSKDSSVLRVRKYRERLKAAASGGDYEQHREEVLRRDNFRCVFCLSTENLCIDHLIPLIRGGSNEITNLAAACKACNSGKSGRTPEEAGYKFSNKTAELMYATVTKQRCNSYIHKCHGAEESRVDKIRVEGEGNAPAQFSEIPTEAEAVSKTMTAGIPDDFCKWVYADWSSRSGKDSGGVRVEWLGYVVKRWAREQVEWKAGTHKGKNNGNGKNNSKPNPRHEGIAIDSKQQGREIAAVIARRAQKPMQHPMAAQVAGHGLPPSEGSRGM